METLPIDGKEFVKASKVAKEFGYTSDYIGQLCRAKKVEARLVGRSWYVELSSLEHHRANRYKKIVPESNEPKSGYDVSVHEETEFTESAPSPNDTQLTTTRSKLQLVGEDTQVSRKRFYTRVPQAHSKLAYVDDETDLIPTVTKSIPDEHKVGKIKIKLADASAVSVQSKSAKYNFTAPKRPKIAFKGALDLEEIHDPEPPTLPPEPKLEPPAPADEPPAKVAVIKSTTPKRKPVRKLHKPQTKLIQRSVSMTRKETLNRNETSGTLQVTNPNNPEPQVPANHWVIVVSTVAAVLIAMVFLGFEQELVFSATGVEERITFTIEHLLAAVYGYK